MSGIGESFTEIAETLDAVGQPENEIDAELTDGGETFTDGDETFTAVIPGFTDIGENNDDVGESLTDRGESFDDGGTESFDRRGASDERVPSSIPGASTKNTFTFLTKDGWLVAAP